MEDVRRETDDEGMMDTSREGGAASLEGARVKLMEADTPPGTDPPGDEAETVAPTLITD